jgi:hypothetical protein
MWQSSLPLIKNNRASRPANGPSTHAPLVRHGRSATIIAVVNALAKEREWVYLSEAEGEGSLAEEKGELRRPPRGKRHVPLKHVVPMRSVGCWLHLKRIRLDDCRLSGFGQKII